MWDGFRKKTEYTYVHTCGEMGNPQKMLCLLSCEHDSRCISDIITKTPRTKFFHFDFRVASSLGDIFDEFLGTSSHGNPHELTPTNGVSFGLQKWFRI